VAVFRLLLVILDVLFIILCMIECSGDLGASYSAFLKKQVESYEQIKELISVDTLKTMQLLGFNYKAAIGEPLTQICADAISNMGSKNKTNTNTPTQRKR